MRSVEENSHENTSNRSSDWDGHDPGKDKETNSLPVDSLEASVAKSDTDGSSSNAHGSGNWELELRENEDGNGGSHLHGATSAGGVVGDLVAHDLHDVVSISDETGGDCESDDCELPHWDRELGGGGLTSLPRRVDDCPWCNGVTDVVSTVCERCSAGGEDLDERVGVLDLVGVFGCVSVDTFHASSLGGSSNTSLCSVDVEVGSVESSDNDHRGDTLQGDDHVLGLVDGTLADLVLVEETHGPSKRTSALAKLDVKTLGTLGLALLVGDADSVGLDGGQALLVGVFGVLDRALNGGDLIIILIVLHNGVVGDLGLVGVGWDWASEEERSLDELPGLHVVVLADDSAIEEWKEEERGEDAEAGTSSDGDTSDELWWTVVELEVGGSLVDDRECADGSSDEEECRRGEDSPWDWVLAHVDDQLDEHENGCSESSGNSRSHTKTCRIVSPINKMLHLSRLSHLQRWHLILCLRSIPIVPGLHQQ